MAKSDAVLLAPLHHLLVVFTISPLVSSFLSVSASGSRRLLLASRLSKGSPEIDHAAENRGSCRDLLLLSLSSEPEPQREPITDISGTEMGCS